MSNLGGYQLLTTFAKKVGGPIKLIILVAGAGFTVLRLSEAALKKVYGKAKREIDEKRKQNGYAEATFKVTSDGKDSGGLVFRIGEKYRILESDDDAILIEKLGDNNNPYFVSGKFLRSISNFAG